MDNKPQIKIQITNKTKNRNQKIINQKYIPQRDIGHMHINKVRTFQQPNVGLFMRSIDLSILIIIFSTSSYSLRKYFIMSLSWNLSSWRKPSSNIVKKHLFFCFNRFNISSISQMALNASSILFLTSITLCSYLSYSTRRSSNITICSSFPNSRNLLILTAMQSIWYFLKFLIGSYTSLIISNYFGVFVVEIFERVYELNYR